MAGKKKLFHHKFSAFSGDIKIDVSSEYKNISILHGISLEKMFMEMEQDGMMVEMTNALKQFPPEAVSATILSQDDKDGEEK